MLKYKKNKYTMQCRRLPDIIMNTLSKSDQEFNRQATKYKIYFLEKLAIYT